MLGWLAQSTRCVLTGAPLLVFIFDFLEVLRGDHAFGNKLATGLVPVINVIPVLWAAGFAQLRRSSCHGAVFVRGHQQRDPLIVQSSSSFMSGADRTELLKDRQSGSEQTF